MRTLNLFGLTMLLAFVLAGCEKRQALPQTSAAAAMLVQREGSMIFIPLKNEQLRRIT